MNINVRISRINWEWIANIENATWPESRSLSEDSNVQILQMHNGVGKTTTLYLLHSLFTGNPPDTLTFARARYKGPFKKEYEKSKSKISIDLQINEQTWIVGMTFDSKEQTSQFYVVNPEGGKENHWDALPSKFRSTFQNKINFVPLFLFDTQLAGARTESLSSEIVDSTILEITNLSSVNQLYSNQLDQIYQKVLKQRDQNDGERILVNTRRSIDKLDRLKGKLESQLVDEHKDLRKNEDRHKIVKNELKQLTNQTAIKEKLIGINRDINNSEEQVKSLSEELYNEYLDPASLPDKLWSSVQEYYANMEDLRIPEVIAKEVVEKIQSDLVCICGIQFSKGDERYDHLEKYKLNMAGADVVTEIFHIKESVISNNSTSSEVDGLVKKLNKAKSNLDIHKQEYRQLKRTLDDDLQEKIDALDSEKEDLVELIRSSKYIIENITTIDKQKILSSGISGNAYKRDNSLSEQISDYDECFNIHTVKEALKLFRRKEADAMGVKTYRTAYEILKKSLGLVLENTMLKLKDELLFNANQYLPKLLTTGMKIHSFENGMTLVDRNGIVQRGANTGGELSAQYSFLMALRKLGEIEIPIVIDNPTKGLDGVALRAFQKEMPELFKQMILMIYPTEKLSLNYLTKNNDVHLTTFHRDDEELSGLAPNGNDAIGKMKINEDKNWYFSYDPVED